MPNVIKYNVSAETLALKKGNFWIGTGDVGKGTTDITGYWNGITPPTGGYTVYLNRPSGGPIIFCPSNDSELISLTNTISGSSYTTIDQCFSYFVSQDDKMCLNIDYERIVTDGLVMNLDAGFIPSYPRSGTTWYDNSSFGNNVTLNNSPSYNSLNGGSILFDGVNDNMTFNSLVFNNTPYSIEIVGKFNSTPTSASRKSSIFGNVNFASEFTNTVTYFTNINCDGTNNYFNFSFSTAGSILTNAIYHWVFTIDSSKLVRMYFNGKSISSPDTQLTGFTNLVSTFTRFGTWGNTRYYDGNLYVGRFYNRSLSETEVLQNYQSILPRLIGENIVTNGLVSYFDAGYYTSYPTTGTTWYDVGGYGNNGTLTNGATYSSNNAGYLEFDGVDDYISNIGLTSNYSFIQNTSVFTIDAWVKPSLLGTAMYFMGNNDGTTGSKGFYIGKLANDRLWIVTTRGVSGQLVLSLQVVNYFTDTNWVHITVTSDGTTAQAYKNGVQFGSPSNPITTLSTGDSTRVLNIGRINTFTQQYWNGNISIVRIYNRCLSSTEVLQNFNAQKSRYGL